MTERLHFFQFFDFPGGPDSKASVYNAGDPDSVRGSGRSPGEGKATHSSTLAWKIPWMEDSWQATVHGVAKSQTRLSNFTFSPEMI